MAGRPMRRKRELPAKRELRTRWWRQRLAEAATPADQYIEASRWLRSTAAKARKAKRAADADQVLTEAARAVADAAARLENRIAG
jgi:hypothetical protein